MWQAIVDFIFDSEYILQLIVAEILCTLGFRRRKYFIVSAIAGIVVSVAFYYGLMYTIPYFSPSFQTAVRPVPPPTDE